MPADQTAIVFDLDDTLLLERDFALSGFKAVAHQFEDLLGDPNQSVRDMIRLLDESRGRRSRIFDRLFEMRNLPPQSNRIRQMIECYRRHDANVTLLPDADRALSRLRARHRLGIITDGHPQTQQGKIDKTKLADRVDAIIINAIGQGREKPGLQSFEEMARRLGAEHAACTYVADNPAKDFIAPNRLGWRTVRVRREKGIYRDAIPPKGGEADCVITSLDDLIDDQTDDQTGDA